MVRSAAIVVLGVTCLSTVHAQPPLTPEEISRADAAIRTAFAFLYGLPPDTQGAAMGTWVLDTAATTHDDLDPTRWRVVASRLTDTGKSVQLNEMIGDPGTSPAQLAASMAAMRRLEGKISKAEAEAAVEVIVALNPEELAVSGVSDDAERSQPSVAGAHTALRVRGDWMKVDDRELEVDYERWSPGTLLLGFGPFAPVEAHRKEAKESAATFTARARASSTGGAVRHIAVTAQGNEEMLDRLVREANWNALAALLK